MLNHVELIYAVCHGFDIIGLKIAVFLINLLAGLPVPVFFNHLSCMIESIFGVGRYILQIWAITLITLPKPELRELHQKFGVRKPADIGRYSNAAWFREALPARNRSLFKVDIHFVSGETFPISEMSER